MIKAIQEAKASTHYIAGLLVTVGIWMCSPQGQQIIGSIVHAYPRLSGLVTIASLIAATYRKS